jgi:N-glycosidase YbiA
MTHRRSPCSSSENAIALSTYMGSVISAMAIYFYVERDVPYGCFSNFSAHGFTLDDAYWPTSEHYFQAQKFVGTPDLDRVRLAKTPKLAANLGRSRSLPLRSDWESVKDEIMHRAVLCKFQTHADIQEILLSTGEELIVENSPIDYYWGCGKDGTGKNRLGLILMQVRDCLRHAD